MRPTQRCPFPGWCIEILTYLTEYLHYDIEPIIVNNTVGQLDWGTYNPTSGKWDGVLGYLENGTADTTCLFFQRTEQRAKYFSYSYPITNVVPSYVVHNRRMDISTSMWNAFSPYDFTTWLSMFSMLIIQTLYCIFVTKVEIAMQRRKEFRPLHIVWKFVRLQLYQPDDFDYYTMAGNFVVVVFAIMQCRLLLDMYQTLLLSALLRPLSSNPFRDADEMIKLIASRQFHLITNYIGNWYFEELASSNATHYRLLRAATTQNPVVIAKSVHDALDKVENGHYVFPIQQDAVATQIANLRCNLAYVSDGLPEVTSHMVFSYKSPFLDPFNDAIIANLDFIRRTFHKYFEEGFKVDMGSKVCEEDEDNISIGIKPLDIMSMFGIILVAVLGLCVSLVTFLFELYYDWQKRMLKLRILTRRAMAEPVHLMALARMFAGPEVQKAVDTQIENGGTAETNGHNGISYISNGNHFDIHSTNGHVIQLGTDEVHI